MLIHLFLEEDPPDDFGGGFSIGTGAKVSDIFTKDSFMQIGARAEFNSGKGQFQTSFISRLISKSVKGAKPLVTLGVSN